MVVEASRSAIQTSSSPLLGMQDKGVEVRLRVDAEDDQGYQENYVEASCSHGFILVESNQSK